MTVPTPPVTGPKLAPKERALLEYLTANAGQPKTREQILQHVFPTAWKYSQAVEVYVSVLRRKLGKDAIIKTPAGYMVPLPA